MNVQRVQQSLEDVRLQLTRKQYCSPDQLRVLRKRRNKLIKQLKSFTDMTASARKLPKQLKFF